MLGLLCLVRFGARGVFFYIDIFLFPPARALGMGLKTGTKMETGFDRAGLISVWSGFYNPINSLVLKTVLIGLV